MQNEIVFTPDAVRHLPWVIRSVSEQDLLSLECGDEESITMVIQGQSNLIYSRPSQTITKTCVISSTDSVSSITHTHSQ